MPLRSPKMKRFIFGFHRAGLVTEVGAGFEHLAHRDDSHVGVSLSGCGHPIGAEATAC